jgi:hypothetical protein
MRIRTIKPQFFMNEELARCSALARLFFIGLWQVSDREGRLEERPTRLKAEILPYDEADVEDLMAQLERGDFIRRYEADGRRYIWIVHFTDHQRITGTEAERKSTLPEWRAEAKEESPRRAVEKRTGAKSAAKSGPGGGVDGNPVDGRAFFKPISDPVGLKALIS